MSDADLASVIMSVILGAIVSVIMVVIADVIVNDDDEGNGDDEENDRRVFLGRGALAVTALPPLQCTRTCAFSLPCSLSASAHAHEDGAAHGAARFPVHASLQRLSCRR